MELRFRALVTRIKTMRSSTMVALGVLAGLVLIVYLKEIDYRNRVNARANQIEEIKKQASGPAKDIHEPNILKKAPPPDEKLYNINSGSGVKIKSNKNFKPAESLSAHIDELADVTDAPDLSTTTAEVDTSTVRTQDKDYEDEGKENDYRFRKEMIVNKMETQRQEDNLSTTEGTTREPIIDNRKEVTENADHLNDETATQTSKSEVTTPEQTTVQEEKEQAPEIKVPPMELDMGLENRPKPQPDYLKQLQLDSDLRLTDARFESPTERVVNSDVNSLKQLVNTNPVAQLSPNMNAKPVDFLNNNAEVLEVPQNHELYTKMEPVGLVNASENAPAFQSQKRLEPNIDLLSGGVKLTNNILLNQVADSNSLDTQQAGLKLVPGLKKNDISIPSSDNKAAVNKQESGQHPVDINKNLNQKLKDEVQGVNKIVRPLISDENDVVNVQKNSNLSPERLTTISFKEQQNQQVQLLMRQYSDTVKEKDLPRQNETYTQRLRNKLAMTGKLDLLQNEHCQKSLPQAIIIGVMKAGTEAFSTFLGVHQQVAMQFGYAAMVFFSSPQYDNGLEWYRERMMCSTKDQVTMEKSPQYWFSAIAPKRIYDMDPNIKLIVLVRDPVARALSHFLQQQSSNPERLAAPTFEDCVYDRKTKTVITKSPYVMQSTYIVILKRWLQYFSFKQILIVDGDTFKKNPTRSLTKTESFLGIDHSTSKDRLYFNEEKGFYCLKVSSKDPKDLELSCFGSEKGRKHPEIDPEVKAALENYFRPYNEEFMKLTGMHFKW